MKAWRVLLGLQENNGHLTDCLGGVSAGVICSLCYVSQLFVVMLELDYRERIAKRSQERCGLVT